MAKQSPNPAYVDCMQWLEFLARDAGYPNWNNNTVLVEHFTNKARKIEQESRSK